MNYFIKFKENKNNTAQSHIDILNKYNQVIWGQWRTGTSLLNEKTMQEMNENVPFNLYILDKKSALLQMQVIKVLDRENVIDQNLEYLIPDYYDINTPCSAYYLIDKIKVFDPAEAENIYNINTEKCIYDAAQVNSCTPWRVIDRRSI